MRRSFIASATLLVALFAAEPPTAHAEPLAAGDCPWLDVELSGGVAQRSFNYTDELRGALRGYHLRYAPFLRGRGTYRPFAHSTCALESGLGVRLGYEQILGVASEVGGQELDTLAFAFDAEVEWEFPFGLFTLTPRAGYVYRHFQVASNLAPDPRYDLVALGVEGGVRYGMFLAELGWSAHFVLSAGSLQSPDWFPNAGGFGYQAEARVGAAPLAWLDAFAVAEYESYSFTLDPTPPGAYPNGIARGSYDRYLRLGVGVRFNVPERRGPR